MARSKKPSTSVAPTLDDEFWSQFGLDEHAGTHNRLLYLALAEISRRGVLDVNARWLTDSLQADPSAVNYHFGSFDGLIAEVFVLAHDLWVQAIRQGLDEPADTPEQRFRNVLNAQVARSRQYGAVIGVGHLPHVSEQVTDILNKEHPQRIASVVAFSVFVTAQLIRDLRRGTMTPITFGPDSLPMEQLSSPPSSELQAAVNVQWALVGPTLWMTGAGGGAREIEDTVESMRAEALWPGFVDWIIASVREQP